MGLLKISNKQSHRHYVRRRTVCDYYRTWARTSCRLVEIQNSKGRVKGGDDACQTPSIPHLL